MSLWMKLMGTFPPSEVVIMKLTPLKTSCVSIRSSSSLTKNLFITNLFTMKLQTMQKMMKRDSMIMNSAKTKISKSLIPSKRVSEIPLNLLLRRKPMAININSKLYLLQNQTKTQKNQDQFPLLWCFKLESRPKFWRRARKKWNWHRQFTFRKKVPSFNHNNRHVL